MEDREIAERKRLHRINSVRAHFSQQNVLASVQEKTIQTTETKLGNAGAPVRDATFHADTAGVFGIIFAAYKPEYYFFDIVQLFCKLILWATLVFFGRGSELQMATAMIILFIRVILHARFEPYISFTDNLF